MSPRRHRLNVDFFIVSAKGKVVDKFVGAIPKEHIVEFVQRLIQTHYGVREEFVLMFGAVGRF
jgi:thioredoxin-like negative regulator of GroEL